MKLSFNVENKKIELQNKNNETINSWDVNTEKTFFFSKNSIIKFIAIYIVFCDKTNVFFCNGVRRQTGETFDICEDDQIENYFMVDTKIIAKNTKKCMEEEL